MIRNDRSSCFSAVIFVIRNMFQCCQNMCAFFYRSEFVVGIQEVTKSLERNRVAFFVVCSSVQPSSFVHHLLLLSGTRKVPTALLPDLSSHIAPLLGIKSAIAFAVLKDCHSVDVLHTVKKITPLLRTHKLDWIPEDNSTNYSATKICVNRSAAI